MQTTGVSGSTGGDSTASATRNPLDRNAFLRLLVTQLRNQDPLNPMEDKEFIAQLAQFSSLEQLQNMNESLGMFTKSQSSFAALGLIGRSIDAIDPETGEAFSGAVKSVKFDKGEPILVVPVEREGKTVDVHISLAYVGSVY